MILRTLLCSLVLLAALVPSAHATIQASDYLIVGTDTLTMQMLNTPLESLETKAPSVYEKLHDLVFHPASNNEWVVSSGCWRGYIAYWRLIDNKLYLDHAIRYSDDSIINFSTIFIQDATGYYPATFYSGEIWCGCSFLDVLFRGKGKETVFVFRNGVLISTNQYISTYTPSPMLGDPLFLHFDYGQFPEFADGHWICSAKITPDTTQKVVSVEIIDFQDRNPTKSSAERIKKFETALTDSLKTVDFTYDLYISHGKIQPTFMVINGPKPILYRKELHKDNAVLTSYVDKSQQEVVPAGKYARCFSPIISANRVGVVETHEGKFFAIDYTGKELFEIIFQSPVISVEDIFRYGYFVYTKSDGRCGIATISGLIYMQPTHSTIDLNKVDQNTLGSLIH